MKQTSLLYVLLIGGCTSIPEKQAVIDPHPVCTREYKIGTNIPVVNCDVQKSETERQQMIDTIKNNAGSLPQRAPVGAGG